MATIKIQTGLRLEEGLYEKLKSLADMEGRSLNNLMEYIARRYIADYEEQNGQLPRCQD
jgi:hypothetical protein